MNLTPAKHDKLRKIREARNKAANTIKIKSKVKRKPKDYRNDKWDRKRKRIYKRDKYRCVKCGANSKMNAHHLLYEQGKQIWDVPDFYLVTLCDKCHKEEHSKDLIKPTRHF
jgi:5-methylcytosine-specific restriction endonuclease McrA